MKNPINILNKENISQEVMVNFAYLSFVVSTSRYSKKLEALMESYFLFKLQVRTNRMHYSA